MSELNKNNSSLAPVSNYEWLKLSWRPRKEGAFHLMMQMGLQASLGSPGNMRDKLEWRLRRCQASGFVPGGIMMVFPKNQNTGRK